MWVEADLEEFGFFLEELIIFCECVVADHGIDIILERSGDESEGEFVLVVENFGGSSFCCEVVRDEVEGFEFADEVAVGEEMFVNFF